MKALRGIRDWARSHTRKGGYSPVGQAFHWAMTALVFLQLWYGWRAGRMPAGGDKLEAYQTHAELGVLLLLILGARAVWRLAIPGPVNDADEPGWQSTAAHLTHYVFYALLVALPLTGLFMWSSMASEQSLMIGGTAPWPLLPLDQLPLRARWTIMSWAETAHFWLVIALLAMIAAHVGAALKHHFIDRDDVLAAMVPFLEPLPRKAPEEQPHKTPAPQSLHRGGGD